MYRNDGALLEINLSQIETARQRMILAIFFQNQLTPLHVMSESGISTVITFCFVERPKKISDDFGLNTPINIYQKLRKYYY